eukprot:CAMPEP_0116921028 /NCGR_PEP_ID=MMETSP0467-20121206/21378_1 /TAXON_ID=283647 /ORGANISM="Mesodinium pulex, Strain SPMC105" /LENGTH=133 /DNA_ID=CAMNT_0004599001 /DNA_START=457 /DNA_END=858 /DNA_ORIENTATION=-
MPLSQNLEEEENDENQLNQISYLVPIIQQQNFDDINKAVSQHSQYGSHSNNHSNSKVESDEEVTSLLQDLEPNSEVNETERIITTDRELSQLDVHTQSRIKNWLQTKINENVNKRKSIIPDLNSIRSRHTPQP